MQINIRIATLTTLSMLALTHFQATAQEEEESETLETIEVIGIRGSLLNSRLAKKEMTSVSDVISAEDIGQFPDINVAESLSHLPGFSVDRQFGEGEKVSIHGTDPALNRIFIDGHTIASADWGGNPNDVTGRTFNYALLAPEIIGQARAYKSPEAWIDEGSIGGTVMIDTRKPLDLDPNTLSASIGYAYNDRSEEGDARGSALYSWHNQSKSLGFLIAGTYDKQNLYRAGIEYFGYSGGDSFAPSFTTTTDASGNVIAVDGPTINGAPPTPESYNEMLQARMPCCINFAYFDQTRERISLSGAVQWAPDENTKFTLTGLHIEGDYTNFSQSQYSVAVWGPDRASDITVANGLVTGATIGNSGFVPFDPENPDVQSYSTNAQLDNNLRETTVSTDSLNLAGEWKFDQWSVSGNIGHTRATGGKDPEYLSSFQYGGSFSFNFDQNHTHQEYADDPTDPTTFFKGDLRLTNVNGVEDYFYQIGGVYFEEYKDEETYGQVDFKRSLDVFFTEVLFGFKSSLHENATDSRGNRVYFTAATDLSQWDYTLSPSGLWSGLGASGNATQFATLTRSGLISMLNAGIHTEFTENFNSIFTVTETVQAGYLQGNFAFGKWRGNLGVRTVFTRDQSDFWERDSVADTWAPRSVTQEYTKTLPSLNLVYEFTDDLLLKAGVAKVMARPRYGQLAGAFSVDNRMLTGGGGNPDLKPYESVNYEISVEYYFGDTGLVAAEIFHRDISSYIVNTTQEKSLFNTDTGEFATYFVTSPFNAENAKVTGVALQGQIDIGYGFGISANATWAEDDVPSDEYNMPYLSSRTVNISPYYENGPFQARLSYGYRSSYFTAIGRRNSRDFTDDYTQLDFSGTIDVNESISVTIRGLNLLDETYYQYSSVTLAPTNFYKNGRLFLIGVNFRM